VTDVVSQAKTAVGGSANLGVSVARVALSVASDRLSPPTLRTAVDVPSRIDDITPRWLTAVLQRALPGVEVDTVSTDGVSLGTSVRARLHLQYATDHDNQPATMFVKSTPTFTTRIANGLTGTAPTEAGFYRELRPLLDIEAPRGYHGAFDDTSWRSIQIIEDLVATKDASFCSPAHVISADEALQVVRQLAALHAQGMKLPRVATDRPQWLRTYAQWWDRSLRVVGVKRSHLRGVTAAVDNGVLPAALRGRGTDLWDGFLRSVQAHRTLPTTLLHGDVHLGNWYVTGTGGMGLCDWQCVSAGHWSRDLAYALATTLDVEQRRGRDRELVECYLDGLRQGGAPPVTFAEAWQLYRRQLLGALVMWTPTYRPPPFLPDMQPVEVTEEMLRRIGTAIVDLDSLSA
jgi:aminoglycoside phosphotransferase (APT) family kinase protein